jgi:hypothetical protein
MSSLDDTTMHVGIFQLTIDHGHPSKSSVAGTKQTALTCPVSCSDDDEIDSEINDEQPNMFPKWVHSSKEVSDDASFSSMSSNENEPCQRRQIFAMHWDRSPSTHSSKRSRPFPNAKGVTRPCPFAAGSDVDSDETDTENTYERTLKQQEGIKESSILANSGRRRIFGGCMNRSDPQLERSTSCFAMSPKLSALTRRNAFSDSALVVQKLPSCLRPSKYSGEKRTRLQSDRSLPVSFSANVTFVTYEMPQEQWAASGWSNLFY